MFVVDVSTPCTPAEFILSAGSPVAGFVIATSDAYVVRAYSRSVLRSLPGKPSWAMAAASPPGDATACDANAIVGNASAAASTRTKIAIDGWRRRLVISSPPIRPRTPSRPPDGSALESGGRDALCDPSLE